MNHAKRRQFLMTAGALLAAPRTVRAQRPGRQYVVGTLISGGRAEWNLYRAALRERLASHGFVEGENLRFEHRLGVGQNGANRATHELAALKVDAIFVCNTAAMLGVQQATKSVPVVFTWVTDPIRLGIVRDLARPGGNITGVTSRNAELIQKRFELALELVPGAKRIAAFVGVGAVTTKSFRPRLAEAAKQTGVDVVELITASSPAEAIENAHKAGAKAMLTLWNLISAGYRKVYLEPMIQRSLELRVPLIVVGAKEAEAGGLIAYGSDPVDDLRRAADMLAKVLKGAKPGDLPVDQAARFELAVNLKTAKVLGIAIPTSIMVRADRVIE